MKARFALLLVFFGLMLALAPPGLCPCWLLPGNVHPHARPAEAETPHSHEDLGQDQSSQPVPPVSLPALLASSLISLALPESLWLRLFTNSGPGPLRYEPSPLHPPPRLPKRIAFV